MTDDGAVVLPGPEGAAVPLRPRGAYVGYRAFATGGDAVLLAPGTARQLRAAAEFATRDGRVAGGLLYGTAGSDDEGDYLVVSGYLEAAPDEDPGRQPAAASPDEFVLSQADLRALRDHAARMYPAVTEVGWWRSLGELGDFGPGDYLTQRELVGPDGVGLLVYGSGAHWGTAYLGPDGDAPELAGTLVAADETAPDDFIGGQAPAGAGATGSAASQPGPPTTPRPAAPPTEPMPAAGDAAGLDDLRDLDDLDDLDDLNLDDLDLDLDPTPGTADRRPGRTPRGRRWRRGPRRRSAPRRGGPRRRCYRRCGCRPGNGAATRRRTRVTWARRRHWTSSSWSAG